MADAAAAGLERPGWRAPSREARDTWFMLALIGWTILPHLWHTPWWVGVLAFGVLAWRAWLARRQAPLPGRWTVLALLAGAAALTFAGEHSLLSKDSGVTLLVVLMALKTLELRARRDALVVFFLGFFLVLTTFLYSQSLPTAAATLVSVWGWLTALTLAHMPAGRPRIAQAAMLAGRAAVVGTPVMIALFLLFPRIGPLWAAPNDSGRSGLSDHLEIGGIAELATDDSIAFRLKFDGAPPPDDELYFRGPVLTDTDGQTWRARSLLDARVLRGEVGAARFEEAGRPLRYEMTLEPTQLTWLPMLELTPPTPASAADPSQGIEVLDGADVHPIADIDFQWRTRRPIAQRVRLRATAWPRDRIVGATPVELRGATILPAGLSPRTRAWAGQWAARQGLAPAPGQAPDADRIVAALLNHVATGGYTYTLSPGAYAGDPVDGFWLDRREGFCEHFATAFVVVLRSLKIPARVVTGYQGTDPSTEDGYWIVRQSNAHAWAEYWNSARGWVRADPTAAVSPDRIRRGQALRPAPGFVGSALDAVSPDLVDRMRRWREAVEFRWNQWVLGYNRGAQFDLLRKLGVGSPDTDDLGRVLIIVVTGAALFGAGAAWLDARRRTPGQRFARRLAAALAPLASHGVAIAAHESPGAVAATLRRRFGEDAHALAALLDGLERQRYGPPRGEAGPSAAPAPWRELRAAARALAARLAGRTPDPHARQTAAR
ncbi:MAG: transglutaminaseTgpA domain-containing protein [Burkholderiaceae bacterium]